MHEVNTLSARPEPSKPSRSAPAPSRTRQLALGAYLLLWVALAIAPSYRQDWLLENLLVLVFGLTLWSIRHWFRLSDGALLLVLAFLSLHAIGAHYTYAEVPYERWSQALTGHSLNAWFGWERNQFDRLVHFSYGLLLAVPMREFFLKIVEVRGFWSYFLPMDITLSTSALFELFEWGAAEWFGGDLGMAYLGTQGDVWDAHKDMALAALGAVLAMCLCAGWHAWRRRS
ncbi:DUF2238 domain-containing protein [Corticibacter populi]|uniref:DUF2238 domain-containing protein n=1 Tax=Corticibacter populi TaxID=1550736 RepID=A0A3M6QRJ6_9BURK|nr:DUF2238 domain-containing protein [Corticibacter populi]RMX05667.1 DUF2238 domain-containing protein [Corticibacter populi]RZS31049.1 putative membrane protein [Corticibacter populi]